MAQKYVSNAPYGKNASVLPNESSLRLMQQRRTGDWGRVAPESTAAYKSKQRSIQKSQALHSGNYFPNSVRDRQKEADRRSFEAFMQRKQAIDNQ
jgi:hypothetical protein